jgi:hypothetical protein
MKGWFKWWARLTIALVLGALVVHAARGQDNEADVLLILAVDVSASITPESQRVQRQGYAEAISAPSVIQAIRGGPHGRIAVLFVEWASTDQQRIVVPWTIISDAASAEAFGRTLQSAPPGAGSQTSISAALLFAGSQFEMSPYTAPRRVIDISGDGRNNQGAPPEAARDALALSGITINALPILSSAETGLAEYFEESVIGGPGAFVLPVGDLAQFRDALRTKLMLEITGLAPQTQVATR